MDKKYFIAEASEKDLDEIERIETESFSDAWSKESFISLMINPHSRILACFDGERLTGYVCTMQIDGEAEILNIAVDSEYRKLGIGGMLLDSAVDSLDKERGLTVYLEVRESNAPARALYRSRGFTEIGIRRGYYRKPKENAVEMEKKVK